MFQLSSRILSRLGALTLLCAALPAQVGVVDQDNTSHDNVAWNMGFFSDMQQEMSVGMTGQVVGFTIKMHSATPTVGLPMALFRGNAPLPATTVPLWSGIAFAPSSAFSSEVYVDCSIANVMVTPFDVLTLRCGDGVNVVPGVSLIGNDLRPTPSYSPGFYENGQYGGTMRLYFRSHILSCAGGSIGKYGAGCPGSVGFVPDLTVGGCARGGSQMSVQVSKGLGYSVGLMLFGTGDINVPIGGSCELWVVPFLPVQVPIGLSPGAAGTGNATLLGTLPFAPGAVLTMQALIYDPGSPVRMSATNGVRVVIG